MKAKAIWIAWENQVRNRSMAERLGAGLYVIERKGNWLARYFHCIARSVMTIAKERPDVVFVQNPSVVLNCLVMILRPFFRYKWVSDAHFIGVVAFNSGRNLQRILDYCNKNADLVIVTNENHARYIRDLGGKAIVCEDPLPNLPEWVPHIPDHLGRSVFYICSFEVDEPYDAVFAAAEQLNGEGYKLLVSGDYRKANVVPGNYPHVRFLGYMPYDLYYAYLKGASVVVDLTKCDDCLLCGAYEAMAAEKPLVTSDKKALMGYFTHGSVYTTEDPQHIAGAIRTAYEARQKLSDDIVAWKVMAVSDNSRKLTNLKEMVGL